MLKKFNDVIHSQLDKTFLRTNWSSLSKDKKKKESDTTYPCIVANSRETSGLLKIAKLLENSGVCGIPTDTVYALAASCKNPSAIEKIYSIKVHASRQAMKHNIHLQIIKCLYSFSADPQIWSLLGSSCREASLHLHLKCGAACGHQTSFQSPAMGVHEKRLPRRHQLHCPQGRLAPQTR